MYNSLSEILKSYKKLQEKILEPSVINDIKEYAKTSRELNKIKNIAETFVLFQNIESDLEAAKEMLTSKKQDEVDLAKMIISENEDQLKKLEDELKILILPQDENDDRNVIVEIRGAAGGDEANIFAGDLFRMYSKFAEEVGYKVKILSSNPASSGGFSQIIFLVKGEKVYSKFKFETGAHRVQRVPVTESQGRIHTSTATVTVLPEVDNTIDIEIKPSEIKVDVYRSGGPGGQSVNTTDSAVRITHIPTGIVVASQDERSQIANKQTAMMILKSRLYNYEMQKQQEAEASYRKLAGHGDRSEKIRTYNFPQDRVTDHRVSYSTSLKPVMEGKLKGIIDVLLAEEKNQKIQAVNKQKE